jgi:hypothetical protein
LRFIHGELQVTARKQPRAAEIWLYPRWIGTKPAGVSGIAKQMFARERRRGNTATALKIIG